MAEQADMTEKQKKFCREYLKTLNATQAAIRAGYSKKTARQIATTMLSKVYIREEIQKVKKLAHLQIVISRASRNGGGVWNFFKK